MPFKTCTGTLPDVLQKTKEALLQYGFTIEAEIQLNKKEESHPDPSQNAVVLFFSNPDIAIPLIQEAPAIAWEFPIRLLILPQKDTSIRLIWSEINAWESRYSIFENRQRLYQLDDLFKETLQAVVMRKGTE